MIKRTLSISFMLFCLGVSGCNDTAWNNPHPVSEHKKNTRYTSFTESPKTLDPARSYSSNESQFTGQIYEPPLQYHFLKRPYELEPLTLTDMPKMTYLDTNKNPTTNKEKIAYTLYELEIKPNIFYQPHPAFAKDENGEFYYHNLTPDEVGYYDELADFKKTGTRELVAEDYVYQIKRLGHPKLNSPILGVMENYIVGLSEFSKSLKQNDFDLRDNSVKGVKAIDKYRYQILIKGEYPQFNYWLAMPFFAPIPWEADLFYGQAEMDEHNLTFDWYPVGTGPYMLTENNPNLQMVLEKNPNFHGETFPNGEGSSLAGAALPFIDKVIYSLEKETIPRWSKFLQGYYDLSTISSDSFDQAIKVDAKGEPELTAKMVDRDIRLQTIISPSIYYMGFNMLDDVVGGSSERAKKLRQAISIALDYEEHIAIFLNGRGMAAQGPIPPGIFGYEAGAEGFNPIVYDWQDGEKTRKSIQKAKILMTEAGYKNGINPKTNQPLILNYDITSSAGPDDKARFDWMRKQFLKLSIQLNIRSTQYNRFQEKMRTGNAQIFSWGWLADYPDPENFLFLLYGPNGKVKYGGENAANYQNKTYDQLFEQMKNLPNNDERKQLITKMTEIAREDAPWIFGVNPKDFVLSHQWNTKSKPNTMANNTLKYQKLNPELRAKKQSEWNKPILWPIITIIGIFFVGAIPVSISYWRKQHKPKYR